MSNTEVHHFTTKQVNISAMRWFGTRESARAIARWISRYGGNATVLVFENGDVDLIIHTLEGKMRVSPRDWVIKGLKNEFYPCKPDVFDQKYQKKTEAPIATVGELRAILANYDANLAVRTYAGEMGEMEIDNVQYEPSGYSVPERLVLNYV